MSNLDGINAVPQDIFGNLPNILSVHTSDGKSWYNDGGQQTATLTAIETGKVYQLQFSAPSSGTLSIRGEQITYPFNFTIPSGFSWFPFLSTQSISIFGRRGSFFDRNQFQKITSLADYHTGLVFPDFDRFDPNKGYAIETTSSIQVTFEK